MSFPSQGLRSWYRNSIRDVSAFMDAHHRDRYRVYNLCSERTYDEAWFHGAVVHVAVDDHNVPSVKAMVDFVDEVAFNSGACSAHALTTGFFFFISRSRSG